MDDSREDDLNTLTIASGRREYTVQYRIINRTTASKAVTEPAYKAASASATANPKTSDTKEHPIAEERPALGTEQAISTVIDKDGGIERGAVRKSTGITTEEAEAAGTIADKSASVATSKAAVVVGIAIQAKKIFETATNVAAAAKAKASKTNIKPKLTELRMSYEKEIQKLLTEAQKETNNVNAAVRDSERAASKAITNIQTKARAEAAVQSAADAEAIANQAITDIMNLKETLGVVMKPTTRGGRRPASKKCRRRPKNAT